MFCICTFLIDNISNIDAESLNIINSLPFKVIASSRNEIDEFQIYTLGFLSDDEAKELFYSYYKGEKDDENLGEIIKLSGNHTLIVSLSSLVIYSWNLSKFIKYKASPKTSSPLPFVF